MKFALINQLFPLDRVGLEGFQANETTTPQGLAGDKVVRFWQYRKGI